jgi:AraC-like DNA-binding protein
VVNQKIKSRNEAALRRANNPHITAPVKPSVQLANVKCIVDSLKLGEKTLTIKEIATRHGLSLSTVYRELKGKLGCFRFRGKWVVTETVYTRWLTDCVLQAAS